MAKTSAVFFVRNVLNQCFPGTEALSHVSGCLGHKYWGRHTKNLVHCQCKWCNDSEVMKPNASYQNLHLHEIISLRSNHLLYCSRQILDSALYKTASMKDEFLVHLTVTGILSDQISIRFNCSCLCQLCGSNCDSESVYPRVVQSIGNPKLILQLTWSPTFLSPPFSCAIEFRRCTHMDQIGHMLTVCIKLCKEDLNKTFCQVVAFVAVLNQTWNFLACS